MTGYGNGEARRDAFTVRAAIRSLNGKYFDLDLRMSRQFSAIEPQIRSRTQDRLQRGSIVFTISVEKTPGAANAGIQVDAALAASYQQALQQLATDLKMDTGNLFQTILQMPDVLSDGAQNQDPELLAAALEAVDAALDAMVSRDARATIVAMSEIYRGILGLIARDPAKAMRERARLSSLAKSWIAVRARLGLVPAGDGR